MARHITESLARVIPREHTWKVELLKNWSTVIGAIHEKVSLYKIADDYVILSVSHPSWAHELLLLSDVLKEKINNFIGEQKIKELRFKTKVKTQTKSQYQPEQNTQTQEKSSSVQKKNIKLTAREKQALVSIDNDELKEALSSFYLTCKQRRVKQRLREQ